MCYDPNRGVQLSMAQRIVFTFDDSSLDLLKQVQRRADLPSMAAALQDSLQINEFLQDQAEAGFSEVVLRNPTTSKEMKVSIPSLHRFARKQSRARSIG
jgi:hypothetical protein